MRNEAINVLLSSYPIREISMITGKMLGDGGVCIQEKRRGRFRFMHCAVDKEWCFYCYSQLNNILPLPEPRYRRTPDTRLKLGYTESYYVQSLTSELNDILQQLWYTKKEKKIPFDLLEHTFTPECLAWWYQDDGHLKKSKDKPQKIKNENYQLILLLRNKYSLNFTLDGQNRLILYDQPQIFYFLRLIKAHIHPSMFRKLFSVVPKEINKSKRTTIYLTSKLSIEKPTKEINQALENLPVINQIARTNETYFPYFQNYLSLAQKKLRKSYQVTISNEQLTQINSIQAITGLQISIIVEWCFLFSLNSRK
ncbi:endonuclease [Peribacillus sp. NPDC076916]|uniref:endonuclease n=1 Tax=Peribacillus sp. NPDC076916 TaxID=3390608 RepID=UPI003D02DF13